MSFISISSTLRFSAAAGELNTVTASIVANGTLSISDPGNVITIDASASGLGFTGAGTSTISNGNLSTVNILFITLGDLDDSCTVREVPVRVSILGESGDDVLTLNCPPSPTSNHKLDGGSGNDVLNGGDSDDQLVGDSGNDTLSGGDGDDSLGGDSGDDVLSGGDGDDSVNGGTGGDDLNGGDGDDSLFGSSGQDVLNGGDGDDELNSGTGIDIFKGGDGFDILEETDLSLAIVTPSSYVTREGSESLQGIDAINLVGTSTADLLNASTFTGQVTFDGRAGNDTLVGGVGNDSLTGGDGTDSLKGGGGFDTVRETFDGNFTLSNTKLTISGTRGTDTLASIEIAILTGGIGNNLINATAFTLGRVTLTGGDGNDTLRGGSNNDFLDGGTGSNTLIGGAGNDVLRSIGGSTIATGGSGDDIFDGGSALDYQIVEAGNVNWVLTTSSLKGLGNDFLSGVFGIKLTGGFGRNRFDISNGPINNVTLIGGGGNDTVIRTNLSGTATLTNSLLSFAGGGITLQSIENARLEAGNTGTTLDASAFTLGSVTLIGGTGADSLVGGSKNDFLDGGLGTDTLIGGLGIDTFLAGEIETP